MSGRNILVINSGSSSIKFALVNENQDDFIIEGLAERIGSPEAEVTWKENGVEKHMQLGDADHAEALAQILPHVKKAAGTLTGIGHRVVHGGSQVHEACLLTPEVISVIEANASLAPLHNPACIAGVEAVTELWPQLPQVLVFDTAFHSGMPPVAYRYAVPQHWYTDLKVRRYGFHGLSYDYMSHALPERHGDLARGRTIVAHLGSGASLCAMQNLQSIATTMGFSALDGLMMGTRTGSLDPGALLYLMEIEKLSLEEVGCTLYNRSGLLGVSGISAEPRVVVKHEDDPGAAGERARIALALYVRRIVREIGALVAVLGGLDLLVFTAGVGEHNAFIRERVCRDLAFLGVELDADANEANATTISSPASRVRVAIEPTNEEWIAARHVQAIGSSQGGP